MRIIFFGDTKTYKSRSAKDLTVDRYGLGDYVSGESSSRTGITYTIDSDNNTLIWGTLPLNDLGFLVIDGMHSLHKEEWRETREALESQRVVVRRKVNGEALARTRVLGIINPGMRDHKPLNTYMFKCQALRDTYIFSDPPDLTRWDLFIPFSIGDVPKENIAEAKPVERPMPDSVFIRHVFWAWSRKPEHIVYMEDAKEKIKQEAKRFMEIYAVDDIPVVHLGYREVIARVSIAYAALMHSTDENHEKVIVKKVHVERATDFLEDLAQLLELDEYKLEREGKLKIVPEELEEIISDLDSVSLKILDLIKSEPKSSRELAEHLNVDEKTVKRRYAVLIKHQLVTTARGKGIELTPRGILFLKKYTRDLGTESVPSKDEKGKKGTETVPKSPSKALPFEGLHAVGPPPDILAESGISTHYSRDGICEFCGKFGTLRKATLHGVTGLACPACIKEAGEEPKLRCSRCGIELESSGVGYTCKDGKPLCLPCFRELMGE